MTDTTPSPVTVVLATGNAGKVREMQAMLAPLGYRVRPQSEFDFEQPPETGETFIENAIIKARAAAAATGLPAIADDSGLEVAALGGAPGVRSARYAGEHGDDAANNAALLQALDGQRQRQARFRCVCVCLRHASDPAPLIAQGVWPGRIMTEARGTQGFGYDPLFLPVGEQRTAAELPAEDKNRMSHRGQAVQALVTQLRIEPLRG
ncbi:RdgB/HAM1 family non-canonical purine NTP pyrophosphatase [uncultured Abyssibacter sp.]|uniref:RdgB/HAM1 family non-canonical purine NTP pyrophosphatase n=1 Tax=uncultured Abyssibacter sp. TaxID=2320202 RepID=UPI0032B10165